MALCKIYSKYSLRTTLKTDNFWCRSLSRWLAFSHFSFINGSILPQKVYICIHSATATIHLMADKHLSECSSIVL